jgi:hypothetical protein
MSKNNTLFRVVLLAGCLVNFLAGCAVNHTVSVLDESPDIELVEMTASDPSPLLLGFVARSLLNVKYRNELISEVDKIEPVTEGGQKEWALLRSNALYGDAGFAATAGAMTGASVYSTLGNDGAITWSSGFWMPEYFNGVYIKNAEVAWEEAGKHTDKQIYAAGQSLGFRVDCVYGCEVAGKSKVFKLTPVDESVYERFNIKLSGPIYINSIRSSLIKAEAPHPAYTELLGFKPAWTSELGNYWKTQVVNNPVLDESGKFVPTLDHNKEMMPKFMGTLERTKLCRELMRKIYNDGGYMFYATNWPSKGWIAFKGELYFFKWKAEEFIKYKESKG